MQSHRRIGIVGAGAWGTAFSLHMARKGFDVLLWVFEEELCNYMREKRENSMYLPGFSLLENIEVTHYIEEVLESSHDLAFALPSFAVREVVSPISSALADKNILILTKGFEVKTLLRMSEVFEELKNNSHIACLSGPSFAREVAENRFTSVVVSSKERETMFYFQRLVSSPLFRVYATDDIVGVELGGALKNVMAIGAGIIEGLEMGMNTLSAYITRALAEMRRLGERMGAKEKTLMGLSGMGDLVLTCFGPLSRNRKLGIELAKGRKIKEVLAGANVVFEGYYACKAAHEFSKRFSVEMPITKELHSILYEEKDIKLSIKEIAERDLKEED